MLWTSLATWIACTPPGSDPMESTVPLIERLDLASARPSAPAGCAPALLDHDCDDWVDGLDLDCDRVVDLPAAQPLRVGSVDGPHALDSLLPDVVEEGVLWVPETRACDQPRRVIGLGFKRIRARSTQPDPALVQLPGGPGVPPLELDDLRALVQLPLVRALTERRDLVLTEQRGMGTQLASSGLRLPGLRCEVGPLGELPYDEPLTEPAYAQRALAWGQACAEQLRAQGVDLRGYSLPEMADDIEALRIALDEPVMALFAGSFGTQHALAVLARHETSVERAVLNGVEGLSHTVKSPAAVDAVLQRLSERLDEDPTVREALAAAGVADFAALMRLTLEELASEPVHATVREPFTGAGLFDVTYGALDAQLAWRDAMGARATLQTLLGEVLGVYTQDPGALDELAGRVAPHRFEPTFVPVNYLVDCQTAASAERLAAVHAEAEEAVLGRVFDLPKFGDGVCEPWGAPLGDDVRTEVVSDVPVLLVAGDLDPRTPTENAEQVLEGLSQGQLLPVHGVSHALQLDAEAEAAYRQAVLAFLDGQPLPVKAIDVPWDLAALP
ncbi:MAG: alpha/beta hydrolase [Myxococcales bacterium]|nr:alpha/beta hydrolase [Myxococcales bacterium]